MAVDNELALMVLEWLDQGRITPSLIETWAYALPDATTFEEAKAACLHVLATRDTHRVTAQMAAARVTQERNRGASATSYADVLQPPAVISTPDREADYREWLRDLTELKRQGVSLVEAGRVVREKFGDSHAVGVRRVGGRPEWFWAAVEFYREHPGAATDERTIGHIRAEHARQDAQAARGREFTPTGRGQVGSNTFGPQNAAQRLTGGGVA